LLLFVALLLSVLSSDLFIWAGRAIAVYEQVMALILQHMRIAHFVFIHAHMRVHDLYGRTFSKSAQLYFTKFKIPANNKLKHLTV
jgi:hypothetical protein